MMIVIMNQSKNKEIFYMDNNDLIKDEFFKQAVEDVKSGKKSIDELHCDPKTREYIKLYLENTH